MSNYINDNNFARDAHPMVIADAESLKTGWQKYYSGEKNEAILDSKFAKTKVKVRAGSANGIGKWSEEMALNYGL